MPAPRSTTRATTLALAGALAGGLLAPHASADELPLHTLVPGSSHPAAFAGMSSALSGDVLALAEPNWHPDGVLDDTGRVSVFRFDGASWQPEATLFAPSVEGWEEFGSSVALSPSGARLAVGATEHGTNGASALFVFEHGPGGWSLSQTLAPAAVDPFDDFGEAVAMTDELLVCGAPLHDAPGALARGTVFVFRADAQGVFQEEAQIISDNGGPANVFGSSVDVSGERIVVGAPGVKAFGFPFGAAYVYEHDGGAWVERAFIHGQSHVSTNAEFGRAVAIDGERILVGAPEDDAFGMNERGSVFAFTEGDGSWPLEQTLTSSDGDANDHFGRALALDGEVAVVGAPAGGTAGAAYAYRHDGASWTESDVLTDPLGANGDNLGWSVELQGDLVLLGAWGRDGPDGFNQGAGLVFDLLGPAWAWSGRGLAGVDGTPVLSPDGDLTGGSAYAWSVEHAAPSAPVALVIGLGELAAPLKGGVLVPTPDLVVAGLFSDAQGELLLGGTWPSGLPSGVTFWLQAWITDASGPVGFAATHGVSGLLP